MDPRHTKDAFTLLEKQEEILMEAYRSLSHELRTLQVEEEMLMRKFYEFMSSQQLAKKARDGIGGTQSGNEGQRRSESINNEANAANAGGLVVEGHIEENGIIHDSSRRATGNKCSEAVSSKEFASSRGLVNEVNDGIAGIHSGNAALIGNDPGEDAGRLLIEDSIEENGSTGDPSMACNSIDLETGMRHSEGKDNAAFMSSQELVNKVNDVAQTGPEGSGNGGELEECSNGRNGIGGGSNGVNGGVEEQQKESVGSGEGVSEKLGEKDDGKKTSTGMQRSTRTRGRRKDDNFVYY